MATGDDIVIKAEGLVKRYGNYTALDNLQMGVKAGEVYCLLGSNGAGKSTTINIFLGFTQADAGKAYIGGHVLQPGAAATRNMVAYIPEVVHLYPMLTGMENMEFFSGLSGHKHSREQLADYMEQAGLQPAAFNKRVGGYSKGMRQKVGIAIALLKQAKALFLDEPTSGLDPAANNDFAEIIKKLSEKGVAVLMATHDLLNAKQCGHTIGIMHKGSLQYECAAEAIGYDELTKVYLDIVKR